MFCTKCGTGNEDSSMFCKNCGAKLVKPTANSAVSPVSGGYNTAGSSGAVRARKPMNTMLAAGLAAAAVVVLVVGVVSFGKGGSNKPLFETIEIGKTSAADVEKYFDKNNLGCNWDIMDTEYAEKNGIFQGMGHDFNLMLLNYDEYWNIYEGSNYRLTDFANTNTVCNDLSDTLWGADCEYFISVSGDSRALYVSCVVTVDGKDEEREFRQNLNEYLKKHQKTKLDNKSFRHDVNAFGHLPTVTLDAVYYPMEVTNWKDKKVLTCLCYNDALLESDGVILLTLYAEKYYSDEELNKLMKEKLVRDHMEEFIVTENGQQCTVHTGIFIDWMDIEAEYETGRYFFLLLNDMYPEFEEAELAAVKKEAPALICSFTTAWVENEWCKGIAVDGCERAVTDDLVIPETIHGYPVMEIGENAFADCTGITGIKIPDRVKYIGSNAFSGCNSLAGINIPDGITEIQEGTFSGCSSLTSINIPDGITRIGSKAFANCTNLTSINIPSSVTKIADDAFDGCDNLVSDELAARFPNAVPKPSWLEAYRPYVDGEACFMNFNHPGIPYLLTGDNSIYHYDGNKVEHCIDFYYGMYCKYSPSTNKLCIYNGSMTGGWADTTLINLDTFTEELYCYAEAPGTGEDGHDWDHATYRDRNGEISKDEYDRIDREIERLTSDAGEFSFMSYGSIEEAYQAYITNKGNISASNNAPAASSTPSAEPASEYILKDSNSRYLTKADLQGLGAEECRLARNEMFDDENLQGYFNSCSWYQGTIEPSDFQESMLNDIEIANKNLIVEYEKEMGYR